MENSLNSPPPIQHQLQEDEAIVQDTEVNLDENSTNKIEDNKVLKYDSNNQTFVLTTSQSNPCTASKVGNGI